MNDPLDKCVDSFSKTNIMWADHTASLNKHIASLEAKLKIAVGAFNEIVDWDLESSSDQVERNRKVSLAALKKIGEVK